MARVRMEDMLGRLSPLGQPAAEPQPAPAPVPAPEPPMETSTAPGPPRARQRPARTGSQAKKSAAASARTRMQINLPVSIKNALEKRADATGETYGVIVLKAIGQHREPLVEHFRERAEQDDLFEPQGQRTRHNEPRTQVTLVLTPGNKAKLAELQADAKAPSRDAYITEALRRLMQA